MGGLAVVCACLGALTACQPAHVTETVADVPTAQPAAPTEPLPPHVWAMNDAGDALMFAPRPSDDIHASMRCASSGKIKIVAWNSAEEGRTLYVASGTESEIFPARSIPGDGELLAVDDFSSEVTLATTNHVLQAFRASGALTAGEPREVMNARTPEELAAIEKFFADCET